MGQPSCGDAVGRQALNLEPGGECEERAARKHVLRLSCSLSGVLRLSGALAGKLVIYELLSILVSYCAAPVTTNLLA